MVRVVQGEIISSNVTTDEKPSPARRRTSLRLLTELYLCGVYESRSPLLRLTKQFSNVDFKSDCDAALLSVSLLTALCKAARSELFGLNDALLAAVPQDLESLAAAGGEESDASQALHALEEYKYEQSLQFKPTADVQQEFISCIDTVFDAICHAMQEAHTLLVERKNKNQDIINTQGDISESLAQRYEERKEKFESIQRAAQLLAEVLQRSLPELRSPDEEKADDDALLDGTEGNEPSAVKSSEFDDEETRFFYQVLPDLREMVPAVLLGDAATPPTPPVAAAMAAESTSNPPIDGETMDTKDDDNADLECNTEGDAALEKAMEALNLMHGQGSIGEDGADGILDGERASIDPNKAIDVTGSTEAVVDSSPLSQAPATTEPARTSKGRAMEVVLACLPGCTSKELADQLAVDFCYAGGASKSFQKKLADVILNTPLDTLQLLPYYCRVLATLYPIFPAIAVEVAAYLQKAWIGMLHSKNFSNDRLLDRRIRNARFVGEMVKFRIFPAGTAFVLLKKLLDDFSGHNIDTACAFVDNAGRYLHQRTDTNIRMVNMLGIMMKLEKAKNLDHRQRGLIDLAYHAVHATSFTRKKKERPPEHEYIRYLIYIKLRNSTKKAVAEKLGKINWEENCSYLAKIILKASRKGQYSQHEPLAFLVLQLTKQQHSELLVSIVDTVMEEIIAGMENPSAIAQQRTMASVNFLGRLYRKHLISGEFIMQTLKTIITYRHVVDEDASVDLDPPYNFFRIRMVCTLMQAILQKKAKANLQKGFLPRLKQYIMSKPPLPMELQHELADVIRKLGLKMPEYLSYEEASACVARLESQAAKKKQQSNLQSIDEDDDEEEDDDEDDDDDDMDDDSSEDGNEEDEDDSSEDSSSSSSNGDVDRHAEDEDEDDAMLRARNRKRTAADDAFDDEFAALMSEVGGNVGYDGGAGKIASPLAEGIPSASFQQGQQASEVLGLRVMTRRGARVERSKELQIPVSLNTAKKLREKEEEEEKEREAMKRMVLAANRRHEEEERAKDLYARKV